MKHFEHWEKRYIKCIYYFIYIYSVLSCTGWASFWLISWSKSEVHLDNVFFLSLSAFLSFPLRERIATPKHYLRRRSKCDQGRPTHRQGSGAQVMWLQGERRKELNLTLTEEHKIPRWRRVISWWDSGTYVSFWYFSSIEKKSGVGRRVSRGTDKSTALARACSAKLWPSWPPERDKLWFLT